MRSGKNAHAQMNELIRLRMRTSTFGIEREIGVLGGFRRAYTNMHV